MTHKMLVLFDITAHEWYSYSISMRGVFLSRFPAAAGAKGRVRGSV